MKQWLLIVLIVLIQETVTLNGLLVKARQTGWYSIVLITLLFIVLTVIDIIIGHVVGTYVKKTFNKGGVKTFASKWSRLFKAYIGKHGKKIYLLLLGYFSFPYLNSFITSWLNIPFWDSFWYLFFGNMLFYLTSLLLVLGITSIVPNPIVAFTMVIILTILITITMRAWRARKI